MGITVQQLSHTMTGQEFAQHYALEQQEPVPPAQWSLAAALLAAVSNGPLKPPAPGRLWNAGDFMPALWDQAAPPPPEVPQTVDNIMAAARAAGMGQ
mgnify:CR=1 FL=1